MSANLWLEAWRPALVGCVLCLWLAVPATGNAAPGTRPCGEDHSCASEGADDEARNHSRAEAETDVGDPLRPFNSAMFHLNDKLDLHVLEPTARGWAWLVPPPIRSGIMNFYENLLFPIRLVNTALQGRFKDTAIVTGRFVLNSTVGLGGVLDPAARLKLPPRRADFGQTLGRWGTPAGPYLVWPILGSSSVRDTFGLLVDGYLGTVTFFVDTPILLGSAALNAVNQRAMRIKDVDAAREASLDFYVAARDAWQQQRSEDILGVEGARAAREEDLYFFDEELDADEMESSPTEAGSTP